MEAVFNKKLKTSVGCTDYKRTTLLRNIREIHGMIIYNSKFLAMDRVLNVGSEEEKVSLKPMIHP